MQLLLNSVFRTAVFPPYEINNVSGNKRVSWSLPPISCHTLPHDISWREQRGDKEDEQQEDSGVTWKQRKQPSGSLSLCYSKPNPLPVYSHLCTQSALWDVVQELQGIKVKKQHQTEAAGWGGEYYDITWLTDLSMLRNSTQIWKRDTSFSISFLDSYLPIRLFHKKPPLGLCSSVMTQICGCPRLTQTWNEGQFCQP